MRENRSAERDTTMDFAYSNKVKELQKRLAAFMDEYIYPNEDTYVAQLNQGNRWQIPPILEELKTKARQAGLWNLFHRPACLAFVLSSSRIDRKSTRLNSSHVEISYAVFCLK